MPREVDRLDQEKAAAEEIAALAAEEERLSFQARERAESRAKARAEEKANAGGGAPLDSAQVPETPKSQWNAVSILNGLAKLHAKERAAAEELIGKAIEVRGVESPGAAVAQQGRGQSPPVDAIRGMWNPALGASQVWYFTSEGERCGPVTFADLRTMASSQVLDPRLDMVWKKGMDAWKQAGLLDGLFERRTVPVEPEGRRLASQPRPLAALPSDLTEALASKYMSWPGVGRLSVWLGVLLFPMLWSQILLWGGPYLVATFGSVLMSGLLPWAAFVPIPVLLYLILERLANLGMSRWWALALVIPVLNLWFGFRCLVCPAGYAYHRKLDRVGLMSTIALLFTVSAALYLGIEHPDMLSSSKLQAGLRAVVAGVVKMVAPR
jgi:hypothetical protein